MYLCSSECYLCRQLNPETRDHVVPACLFPEPRPSDLLTLPCCRSCQLRYSREEEYFRDFISVTSVNQRGSPADQIWQNARRGLKRRPWRYAELRSRLSEVEVVTSTGLFLGRRTALAIPEPRIGSVLEKIARGCHAHKCGVSVPLAWSRTIYPVHSHLEHLTELLQMPEVLSYDGVFSCRGIEVSDAPATSWLLQFYKRQVFWIVLHDPNCELTN